MVFAQPGQAIVTRGDRRVVVGGSAPTPTPTPSPGSNKRVLFIGDSTFVGVGADPTGVTDVNGSRPYSPPLQAMTRLNALGITAIANSICADNNVGFTHAAWNGYRSDIAVTGSLVLSSQSPTVGGSGVRSGAGVSFSLTTATSVDTVEVAYPRASAFGTLGINDGTSTTSLSQANATSDFIKTVVPLSSLGPKTLTFSVAAGTNAHGPFFVNAYDSTVPSVQILNAGARNWKTSDWIVATVPASPLNAIAVIAPHVLVINLGINDWRQAGTTIAQFKTNMQAIINAGTAVGAAIVLVVPTPVSAANYSTVTDAWSQAAALQAYQDLQAANPGSMLVNTPALLFTAGLSGAANPATWTALNAAGHAYDNLHMKAPVYQAEGYAIGDAIKTALGL